MAFVYVATCGGVVDTVMVNVKLFPETTRYKNISFRRVIFCRLFFLSLYIETEVRKRGWPTETLVVTKLTVGNVSRASSTVMVTSQHDRPMGVVESSYVKKPIRDLTTKNNPLYSV